MADLRILVAEDGPDQRAIVRESLERLGASVTVVGDGLAAVERALAEDDGDAPFALVFLDLDMPVMDGLTAARTLRKRGFTGPVIALTARASEADEEDCWRAGFDDYMTKPTTVDALERATRRHVRPAPRKSGVMPCVLVSEYSDDDEMMEIIRPYVKNLPARAAAIRGALDAGDLATVQSLANQLKGSAGSYGFPSITAAASAVDRAVLAGDNPDKITRRVEELSRLVSTARASVPPPSIRSEVNPVEPRGQKAGRAIGA
jgi:CheY-like chemotaxis protein